MHKMILLTKNLKMTGRLLIALGLFICLSVNAQSVKLKNVFNGKNFKNWVVPENNIWWSVYDEVLHAKSDSNKKGSILWTKKSYTDFVFETEFLFGEGTVDSGIFLRTDKQQIQLGISGSLKRDMTGSPYIPGKGYPVEASRIQELLKLNDWNIIKVKAVKEVYTIWLNNVEILTYTSEDVPEKGPVGLQLHPQRDMEISFKNIKIAKLK